MCFLTLFRRPFDELSLDALLPLWFGDAEKRLIKLSTMALLGKIE